MDRTKTETLQELAQQTMSMKRMQSVTPIGPYQFTSGLDSEIKQIQVDAWKNIPMPLCSATTSLVNCIDLIKRFVIFMESRFNNLTLSSANNQIEMNNNFFHFKNEVSDKLDDQRKELQNHIQDVQAQLDARFINREKAQTLKLIDKIIDNSQEENAKLKIWTKKQLTDSINSNQKLILGQLQKKVDEMINMFNVPKIIGNTSDCPYVNYATYIQKTSNELTLAQKKLNSLYQQSDVVEAAFKNLVLRTNEQEKKIDSAAQSQKICLDEVEEKVDLFNSVLSQKIESRVHLQDLHKYSHKIEKLQEDYQTLTQKMQKLSTIEETKIVEQFSNQLSERVQAVEEQIKSNKSEVIEFLNSIQIQGKRKTIYSGIVDHLIQKSNQKLISQNSEDRKSQQKENIDFRNTNQQLSDETFKDLSSSESRQRSLDADKSDRNSVQSKTRNIIAQNNATLDENQVIQLKEEFNDLIEQSHSEMQLKYQDLQALINQNNQAASKMVAELSKRLTQIDNHLVKNDANYYRLHVKERVKSARKQRPVEERIIVGGNVTLNEALQTAKHSSELNKSKTTKPLLWDMETKQWLRETANAPAEFIVQNKVKDYAKTLQEQKRNLNNQSYTSLKKPSTTAPDSDNLHIYAMSMKQIPRYQQLDSQSMSINDHLGDEMTMRNVYQQNQITYLPQEESTSHDSVRVTLQKTNQNVEIYFDRQKKRQKLVRPQTGIQRGKSNCLESLEKSQRSTQHIRQQSMTVFQAQKALLETEIRIKNDNIQSQILIE